MKILAILALILVAVNGLDQEFLTKFMEQIHKTGEVCSEETNASADDIADLISHKVPQTHEGKCLIFCFYRHFKIQREDGSMDKEGAVASLEPFKAVDPELHGKMLQMFVTCGQKAKIDSDPCLTASNLAACAIEEAKALGIKDSFLQ